MTTNFEIRSMLRAALRSNSKVYIRMLRGRFTKAINNSKLSEALKENCKREFERVAASRVK